MKIEKIFKILFNPFRLISLFFLYIGYFFGYFADLFDRFFNFTTKKVNIVEEKTENIFKNIPMNQNVGRVIILILLIVLAYLWSEYLTRINL